MISGGGKKMWTITVTKSDSTSRPANAAFPTINGVVCGPGTYKVQDGDIIILRAKGNNDTSGSGYITVNGVLVATERYNRIVTYEYTVNSNCSILVKTPQSSGGASTARGRIYTELTTT